jgi:hypothetical protein
VRATLSQVLVWALVASCLTPALTARASTLPYIPLDHWATPLITEAIGRGLLPDVSIGDRPYARSSVARALRASRALADSTQRSWSPFESWLLQRIETEINPSLPPPAAVLSPVVTDWAVGYGLEARAQVETGEDQRRFGERDVKGLLLPYVGFQSGRGLAAGIRFRMDTDGERVPDFNGRPWRDGLTGDTKNAYALLQLGKADVLLGRDDLRWGASENSSLLLSGYAPALDQVGLRLQIGPVTASSFFANLDDMVLDAPVAESEGDTLAAGTRVKRHLSGHRIRWQVNRYFALGAMETIVYGGEDRGLEAEYMIPVSIYYAGQWNSSRNDNSLWGLTADLRPTPDVEVYGELLVDDFQIDDKSPADQEPFEGGFLVGQRIYNPLGLDGGLLRVEWAKVEPFTYNQVLPWNRYLFKGQPLGFDLGSDAQALTVEFRHWVSEQVTWTLGFRKEERGATRITDAWPVPVTGPTPATPFPEFDHVPTGTVEARSRFTTEFWLHPRAGIDLRLGGGYLSVENLDNVDGRTRTEWFAKASLDVNWSGWLGPDDAWGSER